MTDYLADLDTGGLQLEWALDRLLKQKPLLTNLNFKSRKLSQTTDLNGLRKQQDDLISALLLHTKALKKANFPDLHSISAGMHTYLRKLLLNAIHESNGSKDTKIAQLLKGFTNDAALQSDFDKMGLTRYVVAFEGNRKQIAELTVERRKEKKKIPVGITLPAKEHIIGELQIFLRAIELAVLTHPEIDYRRLINLINILFTANRTQLRNRTSRRVTAKAKEEKAKAEESTAHDAI